ncbi:MAG: ATP-binding cassette domain-containing protein [Oscillatoriales cyanobacterium]|nr:MAG: ATP-binding cassette domain-containing protein [Oscillatoriales cyanobacterium]
MSSPNQSPTSSDSAPALALVAARGQGRRPLGPLSGAIASGERVAILGPGSRDLLRWWVRLADPAQGQVMALGQSVQAIDPKILRQQVALVRGDAPLLAPTVAEALAAPLRWAGQSPITLESLVLAALDRFGLDRSWLTKRDFQLSPADRLWVALVRASLWEPTVLLLEDLWPQLTQGQGDRLQRILDAGWRTGQAKPTVVVTGAVPPPLTRWLTRVWMLEEGQLTRDRPAGDWDWSDWGDRTALDAPPSQESDADADWF